MDEPAQNPVPNQTDPMRASLTNDNPPTEPVPPSVPPTAESPAEPANPPVQPYQTTPPTETIPPQTPTPPADQAYINPTPDVATPPQESLPPDQYQAAPWAQQPAYPQTPDQTATSVPPPAPEAPRSSSPKGFIIGGLLALIIVAAIFGAMTMLNKNSANDIAVPPPATSKTAAPKPTMAQQTTAPLTTTAPTPTPKTAEVYTNSTYKYQFEYPLGLAAPLKTAPDAARFPSALETIKLNLYADPTSSVAAYVTVWQKVESVPKYITDGQSQFVKVNQYTTNRFTVKKPNNIEETHYLTQKFSNVYDIMLENPSGRISDPVFEKLLNSFTFLESSLPTTPTSSPSSTVKPTSLP